MPRPKRHRVITRNAPHTPAAVEEWQTGIEAFIAWANLARTGQTDNPAALQADLALTGFNSGRPGLFHGLSLDAVLAGRHILTLIREGHWHLRLCPYCDQWLLAKDERRIRCRREACVRSAKRDQKRAERQVDKDRNQAALIAAKR